MEHERIPSMNRVWTLKELEELWKPGWLGLFGHVLSSNSASCCPLATNCEATEVANGYNKTMRTARSYGKKEEEISRRMFIPFPYHFRFIAKPVC